MPTIEHSSGLQAVITAHGHYRFHWMGDHWKQEISCGGGCEAIPQIWSIEGQIAQDGHLATASPTYEKLVLEESESDTVVARLNGSAGSHHYSARFTFTEKPDEVIVDAEVRVQVEGAETDAIPVATYLIESSSGVLEAADTATITWSNPETKLIFEPLLRHHHRGP